jgi:hypothetical protein
MVVVVVPMVWIYAWQHKPHTYHIHAGGRGTTACAASGT